KRLEELLGNPLYRFGQMEKEDQIGTATGLAYTAVGGDTLSIEVTYYSGKGELTLTGKLGDVMRESAQAAFSYIRTRANELQIDPKFNENMIFIFMCRKGRPLKTVLLPELRWRQRLYLR